MDLNCWPRTTRFCFCCSLRVGSLIIGYGSLISATLSLGTVSWSLYKVVTYVSSHKDKPDPNHSPDEVAAMAISLYITHAYLLLVLLYYFIISLLLVVGVHSNKSRYMLYYFNTALLLLVLALTLVVLTCIFLGVIATLPVLKWCLILYYGLIVVRSTYLEMEEQKQPRVYEMKSLYNPQQAPLMT